MHKPEGNSVTFIRPAQLKEWAALSSSRLSPVADLRRRLVATYYDEVVGYRQFWHAPMLQHLRDRSVHAVL